MGVSLGLDGRSGDWRDSARWRQSALCWKLECVEGVKVGGHESIGRGMEVGDRGPSLSKSEVGELSLMAGSRLFS